VPSVNPNVKRLFYDNFGHCLSNEIFPIRFSLEHVEVHAG